MPKGIYQIDYSAENVTVGIYICILITNETIKSSKLIINKNL